MKSNFDKSMRQILQHEGGYVDHPKDPGGATNLGITKATLEKFRGRSVTKQEVRNLTVSEAIDIYRANYANVVAYDDLPSGLDHVTLDPAINSGPSRGIRWLQSAIGAKADGRMGNETLKAARNANAPKAIKKACAIRMGFLRGLRTWGTFGKGWSRRVAEVEAFSMKLAVGADSFRDVADQEVAAAKTTARREKETALVPTAVGGGSVTLEQFPQEVIVGIVIIAVLVVVMLIGQARHNAARAKAYEDLMKEKANV